MARVQIHNIGRIGIIKETDAAPHDIPPEAWSDGQNVRFQGNKAMRFPGHDQVFAQLDIAPYWLLQVPYLDSSFWIAAGLTAVKVVSGAALADITRTSGGAYDANSLGRWSGGLFAGVAILNNPFDVPQYWTSPELTSVLANLTNWPSAVRCRCMRPYKNALVALAITKNYGDAVLERYYSNMVKTSSLADPGTIPASWDETDETIETYEGDLPDAEAGEILDGAQLNDSFVIYKEGSTHRMDFIGGSQVYSFKCIFENSGIFAMNCVASIPKIKGTTAGGFAGGHFVFTGTDLIIHDLVTMQSVVDEKWRKYLLQSIDSDNFYRSFCVANVAAKEMWFCFPEAGETWCTKALTWSLVDGSIGVRDLTNFCYGASGIIDEEGSQEIWDNVNETWDDAAANAVANRVWDGQTPTRFARGVLMASAAATQLLRMDEGEQFITTAIPCYLERKGLAIIGRDRLGQPKLDFTRNKIVQRVWPKISGGPVTIQVGTQDTIDGAVTWSTAATFDPATDQYVDPDPPPNGRLPAIKISQDGTGSPMVVTGFDMELELIGEI